MILIQDILNNLEDRDAVGAAVFSGGDGDVSSGEGVGDGGTAAVSTISLECVREVSARVDSTLLLSTVETLFSMGRGN